MFPPRIARNICSFCLSFWLNLLFYDFNQKRSRIDCALQAHVGKIDDFSLRGKEWVIVHIFAANIVFDECRFGTCFC